MTENNGTDSGVTDMMEDAAAEPVEKKPGGGGGMAFILILIILIGLAIFFVTQKKAPQMGTVMEILPQECALMLQVDLDKAEDKNLREELWKKLMENPEFKKSLAELETKEGVNVEQDVLSWLGSQMTFSFFEIPDKPADGGKADPEKFVMIFSIKDQEKAAAKVKELTAKGKYKEEKYEDVTLMVPEQEGKSPVIAIIKGMLVLGDKAEQVKKVADAAAKKSPNIKENKEVMGVIAKLPPNSIGIFYMDLGKAMEMGAKSQPEKNPEAEKLLKAFKGFGLGITQKGGNFIGTGYMGIDKASESELVKAMMAFKPTVGDPSSLALFPKDTSYYGATDVKLIYSVLMKFAESQPNGKQQMETGKEQFKTQMGIDLDKDIIDNLAGEIAYTIDFADLMKSQMGGPSMGRKPPPIIIAIKAKDKAKIAGVIDTLTKKAGPMLQKSEHAGVSVYNLPQNSGSFTMFEDFFILGIGEGGSKIPIIIDNKMDKSKGLTAAEGYGLIKSKFNSGTVSVGMVQFEKIMPMMEMVITMQASQDPQKAQGAKAVLDYMKQYGEIWTVSDLTPEGFVINFVVMKAKETKTEAAPATP